MSMTEIALATNQNIPTACLLTGLVICKKFCPYIIVWFFLFYIGVNLPDHESLFDLLANNLEKSQTPVIVSTLFSEHFTNIKNTVFSMVSQLLNKNSEESDVRLYLWINHFIFIY